MIFGRVSFVEALDIENLRARIEALFSRVHAPRQITAQFQDCEPLGFGPAPAQPIKPREVVHYQFNKVGDSLSSLVDDAWSEIAELASAPGRIEWELVWRCVPTAIQDRAFETNTVQQRLRIRFSIIEPQGTDHESQERMLLNA